MADSSDNNSWNSYPSVYALGHKALDNLLDGNVIIQEKIDGSQFSFGVFDGELRVRSKGKIMYPDAPEKMFSKAVDTVKELQVLNRLKPRWTYRAEVLNKPHHNALKYDRVPNGNLIIFDINNGLESYVDYLEVRSECVQLLGLEYVPTLWEGPGSEVTIDLLHKLLDTESVLGGTKIEGVVIKNYSQFGIDKKVLMGKYVSEAFKEVHQSEWKKANPGGKDVIQLLINSYRTDARWQKAIQHLSERGELEGSPRDIGALIKEVQADIHKECSDEIANALLKWAQPQIVRGVTRGLPEFYKMKLMEEQFNEESLGDRTRQS